MASRKPKTPEGKQPAFPVDADTEFKGITIANLAAVFLVGCAIAGPHGETIMATSDDADIEGIADSMIHAFEIVQRRLEVRGYAA